MGSVLELWPVFVSLSALAACVFFYIRIKQLSAGRHRADVAPKPSGPINLLQAHPEWSSLPGYRIEHIPSGFYIDFVPNQPPNKTYRAVSPEGHLLFEGLHLAGMMQAVEQIAADRALFKP